MASKKNREKFCKKEVRDLTLAINGMKTNKENLAKPLKKYALNRGTLFTGRAEKEIDKAIKFLRRERERARKGNC